MEHWKKADPFTPHAVISYNANKHLLLNLWVVFTGAFMFTVFYHKRTIPPNLLIYQTLSSCHTMNLLHSILIGRICHQLISHSPWVLVASLSSAHPEEVRLPAQSGWAALRAAFHLTTKLWDQQHSWRRSTVQPSHPGFLLFCLHADWVHRELEAALWMGNTEQSAHSAVLDPTVRLSGRDRGGSDWEIFRE